MRQKMILDEAKEVRKKVQQSEKILFPKIMKYLADTS